jgi:hypothetical protein
VTVARENTNIPTVDVNIKLRAGILVDDPGEKEEEFCQIFTMEKWNGVRNTIN